MKKLALFVRSSLHDTARFELVVDGFEDLRYTVLVVDGDAEPEGALALPAVLSRAFATLGAFDRVVVGTNRRDWALAWYRMYNRLADDFVWAAESARVAPASAQDRAIARIAELAGVEEEEPLGRISVPLDEGSARFVLGRIVRRPERFQPLAAMDHARRGPKGLVAKTYLVGDETVRVGAAREDALTFVVPRPPADETPSVDALLRAPYTWPHLVATLAARDSEPELRAAASALVRRIPKEGPAARALGDALARTETHARVSRVMDTLRAEPTEQTLSALFELLASEHASPRERIMLGLSSLGFHGHFAVPHVPRLVGVRERFVRDAVEELVRGRTPPVARRRPRRLAILAMQLKRIPHAPTQSTASYVARLRAAHPELELLLFSSDDLTPSADERPHRNQLVSEPSSAYATEHARLFAPHGVEVVYSDATQSRARRTLRDWQAVCAFAPDCVLAFGAELSPVRSLLARDYPLVSLSMGGGTPTSGICDVLATPFDPDELARGWDASGMEQPGAIRRHTYGVDFPEPTRVFARDEIGAKEGDFVVVTVSNRLAGELAPAFVETMATFLRRVPRARWLLVGPLQPETLARTIPDVATRLLFRGFEADLVGLYGACDAFANPFRDGGGLSVTFAMHAGIPAVTLDSSRDAMTVVGETGGVKDPAAYVAQLEALAADESARRALGERMRAQAHRVYGFERAVRDLLGLVEEAKSLFDAKGGMSRAA